MSPPKPVIALIAAMSVNRIIGINNQLPWHIPADLAHFKKLTQHHVVLMGRRTFESLGRPLPHRHNIVLTHSSDLLNGVTVTAPDTHIETSRNLNEVLAKTSGKIFVIGGASLYQQTLPHADELYLTVIDHPFEGDTFFPEFDLKDWDLQSTEPHSNDAKNAYPYRFLHYTRHL